MVNGRVRARQERPRLLRVPLMDPNHYPFRTRFTRRAYSQETRNSAIIIHLCNEQNSQWATTLQDLSLLPHERTNRRHRRRLQALGHWSAFRPNGGAQRSVFVGIDLLFLTWYRLMYPTAIAAEIIAFLWNVHGRFQNPPRFYHPSQITRAEQQLGLSRLRTSTTARQAFLPRNLTLRQRYWNMPYPYGIADIPAADMYDLDEAIVGIQNANRSHGKAFVCSRSRQVGNYTRDGTTHMMLCISGSPQGERFLQISQNQSGTTTQMFLDFVRMILAQIGPGTPQHRRTFIMDKI